MTDSIVEESDIFVQPDVLEFVSIENDKKNVYVNLTFAGNKWPGPIEARFKMNAYNALCIGHLLIEEANKTAETVVSKDPSNKSQKVA